MTVYANDSIGYEGSEVIDFAIDWTAPVVNLTSPIDGSHTNNGTVNFTANFSDNAAGVKNASLWVYWSNGSLFDNPVISVASGQTAVQIISEIATLVDNVFTWFVGVFDFA